MTMLTTLLALPISSPAPALRVERLRCEHLSDPLGIDEVRPNLSWILRSGNPDARGERQSAYQIQVASSREHLVRGADLWDTSKVSSDRSVGVEYGGRPLRSHMPCFWRVRVWDGADRPSAWSKPAHWTMGVLSPSEWKAKWIDAAVRETRWRDFTVETSFTIQREAAAIYFRASGPGKAYMWQIRVVGDQPVFRPHARVNGFYEVLKDVPLKEFATTDFQKPHTLRITAAGKTITTYLDGRLIDTTVDDKIDQGSIGFRGSPTESATFRHVRVTDLSGKLLFEDSFDGKNSYGPGKLGTEGLSVSGTDAMLESGNPRTPMLRREFSVAKPIRRAWLYASALGIYVASINGKRMGDRYYAPGWTNYYRRVQYQCYNVTRLLKQGGNAIGAQLAPGWYCGKIAWFGPDQYGADCPKFLAELHIEFADGSKEVVASDESWKSGSGPVIHADNLDGMTYDARREIPGWDRAGFDDSAWGSAHVTREQDRVQRVAQREPPIRATEEIRAESMTEPRPGVYVFRLPQDITGVARVRVRGKAGATVTVRHAEVLNGDGTLNLVTLESPGIPGARAEAIDRYTFGKDGVAVFQPEFTFHGFQYIEVSGAIERPALEDVVGVVYGTDVPRTGSLTTSSEFINRLQAALQWSGRDAFMSAPMDCPQRSERLGWTGDANFYLTTAAFNFDMAAFYGKWQRDMLTDGQFSNAAPGWYPEDAKGTGGGWGDAGVNVPYVLWKTYGDLGIVRSSYKGMVRWIEFLRTQSPGLITDGAISAPGDWKNACEDTPKDLIATAYFAYDVDQLAQMAAAIGRTDDARKYGKLFGEIKRAFAAKFVRPDGGVGSGSQCSYVMALKIGLVPEALVSKAEAHLVSNVIRHGNHLTTGFVGTQWILPVLTKAGRIDLAYALLQQTTQPSWGYMLSHKTTTIWETWDVISPDGSFPHGPYSLNHCALGSCGEWMYETIGGIAPDPRYPGYQRFIVNPRATESGLRTSQAFYDSAHGFIATVWEIRGSSFVLKLIVPVNTRATVHIPGGSIKAEGATFRGIKDGVSTFEVGSGHYRFTSDLTTPKGNGL